MIDPLGFSSDDIILATLSHSATLILRTGSKWKQQSSDFLLLRWVFGYCSLKNTAASFTLFNVPLSPELILIIMRISPKILPGGTSLKVAQWGKSNKTCDTLVNLANIFQKKKKKKKTVLLLYTRHNKIIIIIIKLNS